MAEIKGIIKLHYKNFDMNSLINYSNYKESMDNS